MREVTHLERAYHLCGGPFALSKICGVSNTSAHRWKTKGHLPRTEWTGETHYAEKIEEATQGAVTKEQLLSCRPPRKP
ncbi:MAG: hypothetical protein KDI50_03765 [Candidatus Competibacteraceae bacterium]|nr:hypothetical protein [Candidatus Competibacteraceae bacterium]